MKQYGNTKIIQREKIYILYSCIKPDICKKNIPSSFKCTHHEEHFELVLNLPTCVHKTTSAYMCTQNNICLHVYTKQHLPTCVHKTTSAYMCTQNNICLHVYTKQHLPTCVHKTTSAYMCTQSNICLHVYTKQHLPTCFHINNRMQHV